MSESECIQWQCHGTNTKRTKKTQDFRSSRECVDPQQPCYAQTAPSPVDQGTCTSYSNPKAGPDTLQPSPSANHPNFSLLSLVAIATKAGTLKGQHYLFKFTELSCEESRPQCWPSVTALGYLHGVIGTLQGII